MFIYLQLLLVLNFVIKEFSYEQLVTHPARVNVSWLSLAAGLNELLRQVIARTIRLRAGREEEEDHSGDGGLH